MMRFALASLGLLSLAACQPPVPDNRAPGGVGFGDYGAYELQREAQLNAGRAAPQTVLPPAGAYAGQGSGTGVPSAAELAQAGISGAGALTGQQEAGALPAYNQPVAEGGAALAGAGAAMGADPSAIPNNSGISDEQDFGAVAARETIQSDKERLAENRAQYRQIAPTEVPERPDSGPGPDLVQYALKAPNRLGEKIYPRSSLSLSNSDKNCARYDTPEAAQAAFLKAGGPARDGKNLDPDGDGFACHWDPTPFQKARG